MYNIIFNFCILNLCIYLLFLNLCIYLCIRVLARKMKEVEGWFISKHICGFSDHIKDILPQKGGGGGGGLPSSFHALARSLCIDH